MKNSFQGALLGTCLALTLAACTSTGATDPATGTSSSSGASGTSGTTGSGTGASGASGINTGTTNSSIGTSPNASATPPDPAPPARTPLTIGSGR